MLLLLLAAVGTVAVGDEQSEPITCQPKEVHPWMPIFHIVGNVTQLDPSNRSNIKLVRCVRAARILHLEMIKSGFLDIVSALSLCAARSSITFCRWHPAHRRTDTWLRHTACSSSCHLLFQAPINDVSAVAKSGDVYHVFHQCCQNHWDHVVSKVRNTPAAMDALWWGRDSGSCLWFGVRISDPSACWGAYCIDFLSS